MSTNEVKLYAGRDCFVKQESPNSNHANSTRLAVRDSGENNKGHQAFIYFPINLPKNVQITKAVLRLTMSGATNGFRMISLRRVSENWVASKTTWSNRPAVTGVAIEQSKGDRPAGENWEFNVTSHIQAVVAGANWYGWRIESNETTIREFQSSQAAGWKPLLHIEWAEAPQKPRDLAPSGGGYVSNGAPALSFDFTDNRGNTQMGGFQVQLSSNAAFSSLLHDSGSVNSNVPIYELDRTSWTPLTTDTTVFWRVRVRDAANNWSAFSDPTSFRYDQKGTLAIVSPSGSTITDPSPTVVWNLTGKVQAAWQVIVRRASNGRELYDSGKYTSSANSWQVPAKQGNVEVINDSGNYDIVVRVWDDVDRANTVGSDVMYEAVRTVSYTPATSAVVVPAIGLSATDMAYAGQPGVRLKWGRSEAPDAFHIWRGGRKIDTITPGEAQTGVAGEYEYYDFTARKGQTYDYRVGSSVNGASSETNSVTLTKSDKGFTGIWLVDPRRNIKVQILGDDAGSWEMGEESQTYTPIGATRSRLVTQALRGYEGSISGILAGNENRTIEQQEADMYLMKETPGQTYALVVSDMSIPVVINNITVAPTPHKETIRNVSFNFWQQGQLPFEANL